MSVEIPPMSSSSPRPTPPSPSPNETSTPSGSASSSMSLPSTQVHDSTMLTTFDSTTTSPSDRDQQLQSEHDKLAFSLSAPHTTPKGASSMHNADDQVTPMSRIASSFSSSKADPAPFTTAAPIPAYVDASLRGVEHGVSPLISAFRSPYPPSPSYFITVVPPDDYPTSPEISQHERDRLQRGSLLPLYPTLGGQLWAISRQFALPSVGGLMLYLSDDGQGNRGPRIGDVAWQALWSRYFIQDEEPSTSAYKATPAFAPSRRASIIAGDSFAEPLSPSSAHAADLSRSTLGEGSSNRPSIPYLSSARPSPRVEAPRFTRRDTSAEWSPSARSAAWSGQASSSAGRSHVAPAPFPRLPILARIEWQVDSNKAPWWPSWIASRTCVRDRPTHPTRKSMHLANNVSQSKQDELDADEDEEEVEKEDNIAQPILAPTAREVESTAHEPQPIGLSEQEEAAPSAALPSSPTDDIPSERQSDLAVIPEAIPEEEKRHSVRSLAPSSPMQSSHQIEQEDEAVVQEPIKVTAATVEDEVEAESKEEAPVAQLPAGRSSSMDEPLRSQRASIVSASSQGSHRTSSTSRASVSPLPTETPVVASSSSLDLDAQPRSVSPQPHLESSAALLSHNSNSDQSQSGTGYSEILEAQDVDDDLTDRDASYDREPLTRAHDGDYSALPDSPTTEVVQLPPHAAMPAQQEEEGEGKSFPLRHSFIVDAGDEAMWRDLQHHGMDQMISEPRENHFPAAPHHAQQRESRQSWQQQHQQTAAPAHVQSFDNDFQLMQSDDFQDDRAHQPYHAQQLLWSSASVPAIQIAQDQSQHHYNHADKYAEEAYYNPQRSNMARIQSWIGKTPTGRPNSRGGFEDNFATNLDDSIDDDGMQLPNEPDIDEVVGLWASKIAQDPYNVPHINGPTAPVEHSVASSDDIHGYKRTEEPRDLTPNQQELNSSDNLDAGAGLSAVSHAAPGISLLSPIHLDAAAFDGVKPQLGNLTVPLSPQLLSPTAVGDAFVTPRAAPSPRSVSTPIFQHHPPSSPDSLAPPQDRRPSSASLRSSGDLSDSLEQMQKALELLSPGCSPNPGAHSPDPSGRKMSSRDSLAYARSISASVTPSPKWIARAKAATAKSRSNARRTFAAGGSPFDKGHVSPRPASTSAVSSSRIRSPRLGFQAPFSASRLVESSKADAMQRLARTEVGDVESIRSRDTNSDDIKEAIPTFADEEGAEDGKSPSVEYAELRTVETPVVKEVAAVTPKAEARKLDDVEELTTTAGPVAEAERVSEQPVESKPLPEIPTESIKSVDAPALSEQSEQVATLEPAALCAPTLGLNGDEARELGAFTGDDHDNDIASIQRFLRGKVVSADSEASIRQDLSTSMTEQQPGSSADGTIIERSLSKDSDLRSATPDAQAHKIVQQAQTTEQLEEIIAESEANAKLEEEIALNERWSQVSYATNNISSHHPSAYSLNSNSPTRDMHHDVRTPSFTYDAHLSSEPTTMDTQLSSASNDGEGLSVIGDLVKSYTSSSPSDETFFIFSGPSGGPLPPHELRRPSAGDLWQASKEAAEPVSPQCLPMQGHQNGAPVVESRWNDTEGHDGEQITESPSVPVLSYRFASSPVHADSFPVNPPLAGTTHDYSLDEEEIRTMNEDTRLAVREALSQSTSHHHNILPSASISASTPLSPKSLISPISPISSHSSLGNQIGSPSITSTTGPGAGSNTSSPILGGTNGEAGKRRPARLKLDIDGLARSPPSSSVQRLPSTSPRLRFGQLPPSPSLRPSYKAATSSSLSKSFPVMEPHLFSPQGNIMPSLASVASIDGGLAGVGSGY
ncbi:uncharacterized protein UDID_06416 [Ustilago sp. UG-2017a]|nr:uncharacterized protein UDID_06416 [Ustilago sp. UG-2017a]